MTAHRRWLKGFTHTCPPSLLLTVRKPGFPNGSWLIAIASLLSKTYTHETSPNAESSTCLSDRSLKSVATIRGAANKHLSLIFELCWSKWTQDKIPKRKFCLPVPLWSNIETFCFKSNHQEIRVILRCWMKDQMQLSLRTLKEFRASSSPQFSLTRRRVRRTWPNSPCVQLY